MKISDAFVTITVPWWRLGAAQALGKVWVFLARIFGAGDCAQLRRSMGVLLARGAKIEFGNEK